MTQITIVPILSDNYAYLIESGDALAVVDPGQPGPVDHAIKGTGKKLSMILNTHHHADHIAGNAVLKKAYGCPVLGPAADKFRIPDLDIGLAEGGTVRLGDETIHVMETPGHTSGHVCFWLERAKALFSGDTLFSLGCGRLLEGTAEQMWDSLTRLMALPGDTQLYCGHEYTLINGAFCRSVDPDNPDLLTRLDQARKQQANGRPTLPVSLDTEKKTNAFLRAGSLAEFTRLRLLKDEFRDY